MGETERSLLGQFSFYVGEGVHYLGEDIKAGLTLLFGRGKPAEPELPLLSPDELMERISTLQEALKDQQQESRGFEQQLHTLKQMVRVSQHQQQQIAEELSKLSEVLHRG